MFLPILIVTFSLEEGFGFFGHGFEHHVGEVYEQHSVSGQTISVTACLDQSWPGDGQFQALLAVLETVSLAQNTK